MYILTLAILVSLPILGFAMKFDSIEFISDDKFDNTDVSIIEWVRMVNEPGQPALGSLILLKYFKYAIPMIDSIYLPSYVCILTENFNEYFFVAFRAIVELEQGDINKPVIRKSRGFTLIRSHSDPSEEVVENAAKRYLEFFGSDFDKGMINPCGNEGEIFYRNSPHDMVESTSKIRSMLGPDGANANIKEIIAHPQLYEPGKPFLTVKYDDKEAVLNYPIL